MGLLKLVRNENPAVPSIKAITNLQARQLFVPDIRHFEHSKTTFKMRPPP